MPTHSLPQGTDPPVAEGAQEAVALTQVPGHPMYTVLGCPLGCHLHVGVMAPVLMADVPPASPTAAGTQIYPALLPFRHY